MGLRPSSQDVGEEMQPQVDQRVSGKHPKPFRLNAEVKVRHFVTAPPGTFPMITEEDPEGLHY